MNEKKTFSHRVITWLKNPYNIILLCIILVATVLRLKYYNINMGVWWDEGEYLLKAKNWAFGTPITAYWEARPMTLTLVWALLLKLGASEAVLRFLTELLPSVGSIIFMYLLGKEMYNEKVGLISAGCMSVFWLHLFFTARLLMDLPGLFFAIAASYFFWRGFIKKHHHKYIWLTGIFTLLTILTKYNDGIILIIFLIVLFMAERFAFLKNKQLWKAIGVLALVILMPYMIFNYVSYGDPLPALTIYILSEKTSAIQQFDAPAWSVFNYFSEFLFTFWFIIFLIGLAITLWKFALSIDLLWRRKETETLSDLFVLLLIALPVIFFAFIYKFAVHQYLFLITPGIFLLIGKVGSNLHDMIKKYNKYLAIVAAVAIVVIGGYYQLVHADNIIENKKVTYKELKQAGIWVKENSNLEDPVVITSNQMEFAAYAERPILSEGHNRTHFEEILVNGQTVGTSYVKGGPKFIVVSFLFNNPNLPWLLQYLQENKERFIPVQAYFIDEEKKQPGAIVFRINYDKPPVIENNQ